MRRIDWNHLTPVGIDGRKTCNTLLAGLGLGAGWSMRFLLQLMSARGALFTRIGGEKVLMEGAQMPYFFELLEGSFLLLGLMAVLCMAAAARFYLYHVQDSRSIYLMRRLPDRWELPRRCLTLPVWGLAACGLLAAVLTALYYGIYLLATPKECLLPMQWQMLWR